MKSLIFDVPAMYGDHHVIAVRGLLLALPGVVDVYASSSFQQVEVQFNPDLVSPAAVKAALQTAGYLDALPIPAETDTPANERPAGQPAFFRHTAAFAQTGRTVGFVQQVPPTVRPLWPCPGLSPAASPDEEITHG